MKIGIYGDPHVTKKLPGLEEAFYNCVISTYKKMYDTFIDNKVEFVVCCGDLFDKPVLEASNVNMFLEIMNIASSVPTKYLLGNHEILDATSNILRCVNNYHNQMSINELTYEGNIVYIPYSVDLDTLDKSTITGKIVFTHHDMYGSIIAGGAVKAGFGTDPNLFNDSKVTFNGHIHLRSILGKVHNVGSIFTTQYAELDEKDFNDKPKYYIYDTESGELLEFVNNDNLFFITRTVKDYKKFDKSLAHVVRFLYGSDEEIKDVKADKALRINYKKNLGKSISDKSSVDITKGTNLSMKDMVSKYIDNDPTIVDEFKSIIKGKCNSLFEEVNK